MDATVRLEHSVLAVEEEHQLHAMVELAVPALQEEAARPPLRVALVVDRSGSMHGPKLAAARRCAQWLAERLRPATNSGSSCSMTGCACSTPLGPVDRPRLRAAIASVGPGDSTNLSGGWLRGLGELVDAPDDGPRKILLLTDGLANVGITNREDLVQMARRARLERVTTSTIGFGAGYDEDLLRDMADVGGGNTYFAATPDDAPGIFERELDGLTRVVAHNVTLEVRPGEAVELLGVLNDYPSVAVEDGAQVELGDAYAGEHRRVVLGSGSAPGGARPCVVAELVLRYRGRRDDRTADDKDPDRGERRLGRRGGERRSRRRRARGGARPAGGARAGRGNQARRRGSHRLCARGRRGDGARPRCSRAGRRRSGSADGAHRAPPLRLDVSKLLNQQSWEPQAGWGRPRPGRE